MSQGTGVSQLNKRELIGALQTLEVLGGRKISAAQLEQLNKVGLVMMVKDSRNMVLAKHPNLRGAMPLSWWGLQNLHLDYKQLNELKRTK